MQQANQKVLRISFFIIFTFMLVEAVGGWLTNSLALLSDAGHMLSDAVSLLIALIAITLSQKAASAAKTYGYYRIEILAAALNGFTLIAIALYIIYEAIGRIAAPPEVASVGMLLISTIGLIVNIVVAVYMMRNSDTNENLNMRGAYLHVLSDLLGSVGAIIAALCMMAFGWKLADPIASIIVSLLVLRSGIHMTKSALTVLMEHTPKTVDVQQVTEKMTTRDHVLAVHDVHCWTITSGMQAFTAQVQVPADLTMAQWEQLSHTLTHDLQHENIQHIILQPTTEAGPLYCTMARSEADDHHGHHH